MNRSPRQRGLTTRLGWYVRRLSSMTPHEVAWRATRAGRNALPKTFAFSVASRDRLDDVDWETVLQAFRDCVDRPLLLDRSRAQDIARSHPEDVAALVKAAEGVVAGRVAYFGYPEACLSTPVDWHHDPVADVRWPQVPTGNIDHRTAPGDAKWIWELNRLQHLPWLAQAWLFTGREHFAELALDQLDSWMDQNPVGVGIAWQGAFEAGIRSISIATALQGLRDSSALTAPRFERIVRMLAASADRCWRERSRFSSANNHLVGELAGLAAIAMLAPELRLAPRWEERAIRALCAEASRQILPDGAGAEQAVGYQIFTAELLLVVAAQLRSRGDEPPSPMIEAIDRSADYLAALVGQNDPAPRYGDDDEGFALRLGPEPLRTVRDHLGMVGAFTGNGRARQAGSMSLSAAWVGAIPGSPAAVDDTATPNPATVAGDLFASSGGLVVLRSAGRRLTMDVGPVGYLSIAAHGHADALAVTMSVDGRELIGDPGTASYYGHPDWRAVHRGTRVHPTVTVDGVNQSVIGGPFLWTRQARVRTRSVDLRHGIVDAEHDGYRRLARPVTHRRWLIAPPDRRAVLVVDAIEGEGQHEMRASWPLHPSLDVRAVRGGQLVSRDGVPVLQVAYGAVSEVRSDEVRGDGDNHLGWWSDRLEARTPSWLLSGTCRGSVPLVMATVLLPITDPDGSFISDLGVELDNENIVASWSEGDRRHRVVVDRSLSGIVRETEWKPV